MPTLSVSQTTLLLTANAGTPSNPSASVAMAASIGGVAQTGLVYSVTASAPWLVVTPATGTIPQNLTVSANATSLAAGPYTGTVTIVAPGATPSSVTVNVSLTVAPANPPQLAIRN